MAELDIILGEMREGFRRIDEHLSTFHDAYTAHLFGCQKEFSDIKTSLATKEAASVERETHNYWPFIIKAAIVVITGSALTFIYKLVILHGA